MTGASGEAGLGHDPRPLLDERGHRCPLPVIAIARCVGDLAEGDELLVLSDDPAAATDIPAWAAMRGHTVVAVEDHGDHSGYLLRVGPSSD